MKYFAVAVIMAVAHGVDIAPITPGLAQIKSQPIT